MAGIHVHSRGRSRAASRAVGGIVVGAGEAAWLVLIPCALLLLAAIVALGPWIGTTFLGPSGDAFWPSVLSTVTPEPEEHGRFVVALLGPVLVCGAALTLARRGLPDVADPWRARLVRVGELLVVAFVVVCAVAQSDIVYGAAYGAAAYPFTRAYFTLPTLLAGLALALAVVLVLHRRPLTAGAARLLRETRPKAIAATAVAIGATVIWLLTALVFESSSRHTTWAVVGNILWSMNETYAVLNGSGPLTDFHAQYAQLWPYVVAAPMALLGPSVDVYTATLAAIDLAALLAVFAVLRRVVRSSLAALLLYLPFLATGFFMKLGPLDDRYGPSNLFSVWPVRYAGPYLLAWLTARHVDRLAPRRDALLLGCASLVAINNPEFGAAAFAATVAALLWATPPRSWRPLARLAADAALGLLGACALVAILTLAVVGQLPDFAQIFEFSRIYGVEGWGMTPMPTLGLHLVAYVTFAAAVVVATTRAAARTDGTLLTAMLAWSGVFGLLAGAYYAGRSHPEVLIDLFSAWALCVVLLAVVVVRAIAARPSRRPSPAELLVLCGLGVAACSLAQFPTPWSQIDRLGRAGVEPELTQEPAVRFVADATAAGEPVAILIPLSHRIAHEAGVANVAPYSSFDSMPTQGQLDTTIAALRRAGGRHLYTWDDRILAETLGALGQAGFVETDSDELRGYREWTDRGG